MSALFRFAGSLKFSVILLAFSEFLIFFGTLDQVQIGIRAAQKIYFESFLAFWSYPEFWPGGEILRWIHIPLPGGYLVGGLLLINLVLAHFRYYRHHWSHLGLIMVHWGIVVLLLGQLSAHLFQKENYMWVDEGDSSSYTVSFHDDELVFINHSMEATQGVVSVPLSWLGEKRSIQHPEMPFRAEVKAFYRNARLVPANESGAVSEFRANQGIGAQLNLQAFEQPPALGDNERNLSAAFIEIHGPDGSLGQWLVANVFEDQFPPQTIQVNGETWEIALRFKRHYLPFSITLNEFTHERYPCTNIPRNFASKVTLKDFETGETRKVEIYMNHPLRYRGLTFYQSSYGKNDTASMFQVVQNPGRSLPYISCLLVTVGLVFQFAWLYFHPRKETAS